MASVLIIAESLETRSALSALVEKLLREVLGQAHVENIAASGEQAIRFLEEKKEKPFDLVIATASIQAGDGSPLATFIKQRWPDTTIALIGNSLKPKDSKDDISREEPINATELTALGEFLMGFFKALSDTPLVLVSSA